MKTFRSLVIYLWYDMTFNNDRMSKKIFESIEVLFSGIEMYLHYTLRED